MAFTRATVLGGMKEADRFSRAFRLLHEPESNIEVRPGIDRASAPGKLDILRDNWRCALKNIPVASNAAFLSAADMKEAAAEAAKLAAAGGG